MPKCGVCGTFMPSFSDNCDMCNAGYMVEAYEGELDEMEREEEAAEKEDEIREWERENGPINGFIAND